MKKFSFSLKAFPYLVVHRSADGSLSTAVAGFDNRTLAAADADERTTKAKAMGLVCTYEVLTRAEGEGMKDEK